MKLQVLFSVLLALAAAGAPVQLPRRALPRSAKRDFNLKPQAPATEKVRRDVDFDEPEWAPVDAVGNDAPGQSDAGPEWPRDKRTTFATVSVKSVKRDQVPPAKIGIKEVKQPGSQHRRSHHHGYPGYNSDYSTDTDDEYYRIQPMPPSSGYGNAPPTGVGNGLPSRRRRSPQVGATGGRYPNGYDSDTDGWSTDSEDELYPAAPPAGVSTGGRPRRRRTNAPTQPLPEAVPGHVAGNNGGYYPGHPGVASDREHPAGGPVPDGLPTPSASPLTGNTGRSLEHRRQRVPANPQPSRGTGYRQPNAYDSDGNLRYNSSEDESRLAPSAPRTGGRNHQRRQRAPVNPQQGGTARVPPPNAYDSDGNPRYNSSEDESRFALSGTRTGGRPHRRQRIPTGPQQVGSPAFRQPNAYDSDGNPRYNSSEDESRAAPANRPGGRPLRRRQRAAPSQQGVSHGAGFRQPNAYDSDGRPRYNSSEDESRVSPSTRPMGGRPRRRQRVPAIPQFAGTQQGANSQQAGASPLHQPNAYDSDGNLRYNSSEDESARRPSPAAGGHLLRRRPRAPGAAYRQPNAYDSEGHAYYNSSEDEYGAPITPPSVGVPAGSAGTAAGGVPPASQPGSGGLLSGLLSSVGLKEGEGGEAGGDSAQRDNSTETDKSASKSASESASKSASKRHDKSASKGVIDPDHGVNDKRDLPWC